MAKREVYLVPTLKADVDVVEGADSDVPGWIVDKMRETREAALKSVRAARRAGVPIAMGSDAGTPLNFHGQNGLEVVCMQQAGLKPMECLVAATLTAARALGREQELGSIEEGKLADLLVLDKNPLEDLKRLGDRKTIRAVFRDGMLVARQPGDAYPRTILSKDCLTVGQ